MAYLDENGLEHFWGKIKDRVSSAVAPKADDADVVHKTGDETVQGVKTFQNNHANVSSQVIIKSTDIVKGTASFEHNTGIVFADSTGNDPDNAGRLASVVYHSPANENSDYYTHLVCNNFYGSGNSILRVGYDGNNTPYSTAPATSEDRTDSTDIVTRGYMEASEWNWQKSKKNVLVQFKPVPESDLEPVVDFMFTETPPAEGEKGPENPSTITGVASAEVTLTGKNLVSLPYHTNSVTINDITWTVNSDNSVTANGTASADSNFYFTGHGTTKLRPAANSSYFLSGCPAGGSTSTYYITAVNGSYDNNTYVRCYDTGSGTAYVPKSSDLCIVHAVIKQGTTVNNITFRPQLESGNSKTDYELVSRERATIQFGDTYYGGSLDVAAGVMTVNVAIKIFNGTESWISGTPVGDFAVFYNSSSLYPDRTIPRQAVCTHFNFTTDMMSAESGFGIFETSYGGFFKYPNSSTTASEFKAFIASQYANGTPVTVYYNIEPFTVQLTPTQIRSLPALDKYEPRINTVYTDQEAVQVGYQRFANYVDLTTDQTIDGRKTFVEQLFINTGSDAYQAGVFSSQLNGVRLSSEAFSVSSSGAYLDLNGRSASSSAGCFGLGANSSAGSKLLQGKPDGTLTWNNKDITGDVHTTGNETIAGRKRFSDVTTFGSTSNAYEQLVIASVTNGVRVAAENFGTSSRGAGLQLSGRSSPTDAGQFTIFAANATGDKNLIGKPDGTLTWNGQAIQTSSDERVKTSLSEVPDAVLDAWEEVNWGQFQYLDAVKEKGESARLHLGLIAQHVISVFKKHGLDACAYGILCHEEHEAAEDSEAVDLWMVRYAEAQAMEACCARRENARLKKRIAGLEERLAALELKIS